MRLGRAGRHRNLWLAASQPGMFAGPSDVRLGWQPGVEPHTENVKRLPSMPNAHMSIPSLLRERAAEDGDDTAFTFMDGALDGTGYPESLTWAQVYRRSLVLAEELRRFGST